MKFKEFKEEIEKLGLYVEEKEEHIDIRGKDPNRSDKYVDYCGNIAKRYRDSLGLFVIYKDNWSREKQKRFMELCIEFAMTEPKER